MCPNTASFHSLHGDWSSLSHYSSLPWVMRKLHYKQHQPAPTVSNASCLLLWTSVWPISPSAPFLLLWGFIPRGSTYELWDTRDWEQILQVKTGAKSELSNLFFLMPFCLNVFAALFSLLIYSTLSCCSLCPLLVALQLSFDIPNFILALLENLSMFSGKSLHIFSFFFSATKFCIPIQSGFPHSSMLDQLPAFCKCCSLPLRGFSLMTNQL